MCSCLVIKTQGRGNMNDDTKFLLLSITALDPRRILTLSPQQNLRKSDITEKKKRESSSPLEVIRGGVVSAVAYVPNTSKRDVFTHTHRGSQPAKQIINKVSEIN